MSHENWGVITPLGVWINHWSRGIVGRPTSLTVDQSQQALQRLATPIRQTRVRSACLDRRICGRHLSATNFGKCEQGFSIYEFMITKKQQHRQKYKPLCPRGTQTCALQTDTRRCPQPTYRQTDTRRCPQPTSRLTEMEKWSWISIQNPISTEIELVLEVHPLLPPTKFGGDPWTRSWDILRTKECAQTHRHTYTQTQRHTPMTTRPCGLRRAGKKNSVRVRDGNRIWFYDIWLI